ncbi:MAG: preprotein translocase subunit YajC [Sphingomicrobium sp.]
MSTPFLATMIAAATAAPQSGFAALANMLFLPLALFLIFWVLVFRPQAKRQKEQQAEIMGIKKGDDIITGGGIRGRVTKVTDDEAEVEIAPGVKVRVVKATINGVAKPKTKPAND